MPRGGARPGAGRKKGSTNKRSTSAAAQTIAAGNSPLDVGFAAMHALFAKGDHKAAGDLAAKLAPFVHPRFSPLSDHQLEPHAEQKKNLPLFDQPLAPKAAPLGKKAAADEAALAAGEGTGWGDLLSPDKTH